MSSKRHTFSNCFVDLAAWTHACYWESIRLKANLQVFQWQGVQGWEIVSIWVLLATLIAFNSFSSAIDVRSNGADCPIFIYDIVLRQQAGQGQKVLHLKLLWIRLLNVLCFHTSDIATEKLNLWTHYYAFYIYSSSAHGEAVFYNFLTWTSCIKEKKILN